MLADRIAAALLIYILLREFLYAWSTHRLINKLMARNYHDYEFSKNVKQTMKEEPRSLSQGLSDEYALKEDLAPIENFLG